MIDPATYLKRMASKLDAMFDNTNTAKFTEALACFMVRHDISREAMAEYLSKINTDLSTTWMYCHIYQVFPKAEEFTCMFTKQGFAHPYQKEFLVVGRNRNSHARLIGHFLARHRIDPYQ